MSPYIALPLTLLTSRNDYATFKQIKSFLIFNIRLLLHDLVRACSLDSFVLMLPSPLTKISEIGTNVIGPKHRGERGGAFTNGNAPEPTGMDRNGPPKPERTSKFTLKYMF